MLKARTMFLLWAQPQGLRLTILTCVSTLRRKNLPDAATCGCRPELPEARVCHEQSLHPLGTGPPISRWSGLSQIFLLESSHAAVQSLCLLYFLLIFLFLCPKRPHELHYCPIKHRAGPRSLSSILPSTSSVLSPHPSDISPSFSVH